MKKRKILQGVVSLLLLLAIGVNLASCTVAVKAADLMEGVSANPITPTSDLSDGNAAATDFAMRLFLACHEEGENTLISPLSVLYALAMTQNGAREQTLAQMQEVLGLDAAQLNLYLYSYRKALEGGDTSKLSVANSIWFTDAERFSVNRDFLQINADYYGADIYQSSFSDKQTLRDINNWVKKETDGMIDKVLDKLSPSDVMYLINALAFEAEWRDPYETYQVRDGVFHREDGTDEDVSFMYSTEGTYLCDENATGFIKYYKGSQYAFVALLPNEGVSVSEYLATLDGARVRALLEGKQYAEVRTSLPKFKCEYETELSEILCDMGMSDVFDAAAADLSGLGTSEAGNLYVSTVIHKTFIEVAEKGTRAGAVTVVGVNDSAAAPPEDPKTVYLDRPFVYMLIDYQNNIPFFIGTAMDIDD